MAGFFDNVKKVANNTKNSKATAVLSSIGAQPSIQMGAPGGHSKSVADLQSPQSPLNTDGDDSSGGSPYGSYGYGGYGYGGYGSSGDTGPSDNQKNAALNLQPILAYNGETARGKAENARDAYDTADQGNMNRAAYDIATGHMKASNEWFSRLLKEQSVYDMLRTKMGNSRYGSNALQLNTDMNRVHDADAVEVLETQEENDRNIFSELTGQLQDNVNAFNEMALDTETSLKNMFADYAAQLNNIHPDLVNGEIDLEAYRAGKINGDEDIDDEGGDDTEKLIDIESRTLNPVDWFPTSFYNENKRGALSWQNDDYLGHIRPDRATQSVESQKRFTRDSNPSSSAAANKRYWDTLTTTYGQRRV